VSASILKGPLVVNVLVAPVDRWQTMTILPVCTVLRAQFEDFLMEPELVMQP
jgi:hypothetical protein